MRPVNVLVLAAAVVGVIHPLSVMALASECASCRYAAWNCSASTAVSSVDSGDSAAVHGDLRKAVEPMLHAVQVCDDAGKIQVDDVFCDSSDCACTDDRQCVSLVVGCQNIFQARSRKRCIGDTAIQQRFHQCAKAQALTAQPTANLDSDWVHFKDPQRCKSTDCLATRRFHQCAAVQCGYLIVAWKESDSAEYRFIVDGSRASDMAAGTFLFRVPDGFSTACSSITSTPIQDCHALQTRNQKNGTCTGIYLELDTKFKAHDQEYKLSTLSWSVWFAVVGSVAAAAVSVASVLVVYLRFRRSQQNDELDDLLPADADSDCKTPAQDTTPAVTAMRQRTLSPRSQQLQ